MIIRATTIKIIKGKMISLPQRSIKTPRGVKKKRERIWTMIMMVDCA